MWLVHEQVAVAALDAHALPFAASVIKAINRRFPDSVRARRLQVRRAGRRGLWVSICIGGGGCRYQPILNQTQCNRARGGKELWKSFPTFAETETGRAGRSAGQGCWAAPGRGAGQHAAAIAFLARPSHILTATEPCHANLCPCAYVPAWNCNCNRHCLQLPCPQSACLQLPCLPPTSCLPLPLPEAAVPPSSPAPRVQGMYFEAAGDFPRAEEMYRDVLATHPNNEMALKRMVRAFVARHTP